jgi:hypothetical protein
MRSRRKPPSWLPLTIEHRGHVYEGRYAVVGQMLRVQSAFGGKATLISATSPAVLAAMLLRELVRDRIR